MQDRRQHDRRVQDLENDLCKHIKSADERWESIEVHIQEMKEILKSLDIDSLKAVSEVIKGGVTFTVDGSITFSSGSTTIMGSSGIDFY